MKRNLILAFLVGIVAVGVLIFYSRNSSQTKIVEPSPTASSVPVDITEHINSKKDLIVIDTPEVLESVKSPLEVRGQARGGWFFEATFPIVVVNWDGKIIGEGYAEATDDWMTEDFVPFEATIEFETPNVEQSFMKRGAVIFQKSNASDLPENDDALEIPVVFE